MKLFLSVVLLVAAAFRPATAQNLPPFVPMTDEAPLRKILIAHSDLKDPFSAQFRDTVIREIVSPEGEVVMRVWCGQINAKNSNGGYSGWSYFAVSDIGDNPIISIVDGESTRVAKTVIGGLCEGAKISGI